MVEVGKPVRVAVNVMRARLTVLGFNIAIVSFQIAQLYRVSGGLKVPGIVFGSSEGVGTTVSVVSYPTRLPTYC